MAEGPSASPQGEKAFSPALPGRTPWTPGERSEPHEGAHGGNRVSPVMEGVI
jgi:hypothetical protein